MKFVFMFYCIAGYLFIPFKTIPNERNLEDDKTDTKNKPTTFSDAVKNFYEKT